MFALILFDDGQYYACSTKRIKTDLKTGTTSIKWDDRQYYPGKVIVTHNSLKLVNAIMASIIGGLPKVVLTLPPKFERPAPHCKNLGEDVAHVENLEEDVAHDQNLEEDVALDQNLKDIVHDSNVGEDVGYDQNLGDVAQDPNLGEEVAHDPNLGEDDAHDPNLEDVAHDQNLGFNSTMLDHCYGAQLYSSICTTSTNSEKGMHIDEADDDFQVIRRSKALRRLSFGSSAEEDHVSEADVQQNNAKVKARHVTAFDRATVSLPPINNDKEPPIDRALDTIAVPTSTGRNSRRYFCVYCKKLFAKLTNHLQGVHKNERAVQQYMLLPSGCKERRKFIETIRRQGDFEHNTNPYYNTGSLFIARRPKEETSTSSYLPCSSCKAFFTKKALYKHFKNCSFNGKNGMRQMRVFSRALQQQIHQKACYTLRTRIFPVLRDDGCVSVIRYDLLVILLANHWCSLYADQHFDDMIRAKLRVIGRLLIAAREFSEDVGDFSSLINPTNYDLVVSAINKVAGLNVEGTTYNAPSTATMLTAVCKLAADIWKIECIKRNDGVGVKAAENFLTLFKLSTKAVVNRTATENRTQQLRQKTVELPEKDDIRKLVAYVRDGRRSYLRKLLAYNKNDIPFFVWQCLASYTLISLLVFNRRRPGELERIRLDDYSNLQTIDNVVGNVGHLSNEELKLANRYKRFEIRGKLNRAVPVLVHWELQACLDAIISNREHVGVPQSNPYVFGLPSVDNRHRYLRACVIIREYAVKCGADRHDLLRATSLRKQIATECAVRDLSDNVIRDVANFMGHAFDIHENIYRLPVQTRDIVQMSNLLELIQGKDNDDEEDDDNTDHQPQVLKEVNTNASSSKRVRNEDKLPTSKRTHTTGLTRHCGNKMPWTSSEKAAALHHFKRFLKKQELPSLKVLSSLVSNIPELSARTLPSIKLWIENNILQERNKQFESTEFLTPKKCKYKSNGKIQRARWRTPVKLALKEAFSTHFRKNTLPSNPEIRQVMDKYDCFQGRTIASIKTAIANEQKRLNKFR